MSRFVLIAALLTASPALADEPAVPRFPSRHIVLSNGLDVYLEYDDTSPMVAVSVSYAAGSREDPHRKPGLAHLTEHVTYQGTRDLGEDEVIATLERIGAQSWNGQTSDDEASYFARAPRDSVSTLLWIEAQRMAFVLSHANEETVAHQRQVVSREWYDSVGDHAGSAASSILESALFPAGHPYARLAATPAETARLTLEDVQWFYQTYYRPSRARLAVVGDVPLDEAERLVRGLFEGIVDRGPRFVRTPSRPVTSSVDRAVVLRAPTAPATLTIAWPTPAYFEPLDAELDVLASVLCANESAELGSWLVQRRRLAIDVSCIQASRGLASSFYVEVVLAEDSDPAAVLGTIEEVFFALTHDGIEDDLIRSARDEVIRHVLDNVHDPLYRATMATSFVVSTRASVDRYSGEADVARYRAVSRDSVMDALELLNRNGRAIVLMIPDPDAPDEGIVVDRREIAR